jgi:hypothetical protein
MAIGLGPIQVLGGLNVGEKVGEGTRAGRDTDCTPSWDEQSEPALGKDSAHFVCKFGYYTDACASMTKARLFYDSWAIRILYYLQVTEKVGVPLLAFTLNE